jgi:hypothetical protein
MEQAALQKIQPHQSLRSALINSSDRPGAKAVCYNIAPGSPLYPYTRILQPMTSQLLRSNPRYLMILLLGKVP